MSFPVCCTCGVELLPGITCEHVKAVLGPRPKLTRCEQLKASRMTSRDWARTFPTGVVLNRKRTTPGMISVDLDAVLP